ncbi:MAG: GNAT family N-acetyltransferase [Oscillospiraceae bacterium]|jgi:RimJ/RimL family protein N-acetyltransferase|nr:GNAT family N-acetyltransferase [Oscillospiraceae bacterium]
MLNFKPVTQRDGAKLRRYYKDCSYGLCEYAVGTKLMWRPVLHPAWTEAGGCLIVKNEMDGRVLFDYPVPGLEGNEETALREIESYCIKRGVPLVISVVPDAKAPVLLARYPYVKVSNIRTWRDYIYNAEDLQNFTGRRYNGQRNHVRKFRKSYPAAAFRPLTEADFPAIEAFWTRFEEEFEKDDFKAERELALAKKLLRLLKKPWFCAGGIFDGEKLIALSLAEKCGQTLIIHIEKALYSYEGAYPTLVQAFASCFGRGVRLINREDDSADRGLRTSKLQYGPVKLAPKYYIEPLNELLCHVRDIPALTTRRLTLSKLTKADIPAYNALVLDAGRNRYWGYNDVGGLGGPVKNDSFFKIARDDFKNCAAVNFAVRLDGRFIGEAVLYNFNYRGDAELGCRIDAEYAGNGYGTEAFAVVADWALYQVHLTRVIAKCYKDNGPSFKMLSAVMKKSGEDETFFYFEKLV